MIDEDLKATLTIETEGAENGTYARSAKRNALPSWRVSVTDSSGDGSISVLDSPISAVIGSLANGRTFAKWQMG